MRENLQYRPSPPPSDGVKNSRLRDACGLFDASPTFKRPHLPKFQRAYAFGVSLKPPAGYEILPSATGLEAPVAEGTLPAMPLKVR